MLVFVEPKNGIWVSVAGDLEADYIFHVNTTSESWPKIVSNCLAACDYKRVSSIAFPAIGTGIPRTPSTFYQFMVRPLYIVCKISLYNFFCQ